MATATTTSATLLATDLAPFEANHVVLRPIITQFGGSELGTAGKSFIASFAGTPEGVAQAVDCARKFQEALAPRHKTSALVHLGSPEGADLATLLALHAALEPASVALTEPALELAGGPAKFGAAVVTTGALKTASDTAQVAVYKIAEPPKTKGLPTLKPVASAAPQKTSDATSRFSPKRLLGFLGPSTASITLKVIVAAMTCSAVLIGIRAKRDFSVGKEEIAASASAASADVASGVSAAAQAAGASATPAATAAAASAAPATTAVAPAAAASATPAAAAAAPATATTASAAPDAPAAATATAAAAAPPTAPAAATATAAAAAPPTAPAAATAATAAPAAGAAAPAAPAVPAAATAMPAAPPTAAVAPAAPAATAAAPATPAGTTAPAAAATAASAAPTLNPEIEAQFLNSCAKDPQFCATTGLTFLKDGAPAIAAKFFEKGCALGTGDLCTRMGLLFKTGTGVDRSDLKAADFFLRGCDLKSGDSCVELGIAYWRGVGVPRSPSRASEAFARGCTVGSGEACLVLGLGAQTPQNGGSRAPAAATDFLSKGCKLLNIDTCSSATAGK